MKFICFSAICLLTFAASAQPRMASSTLASMHVIQRDLKLNNGLSQATIDFYPVYKMQGKYYVAALSKVNSAFSKEEAQKSGLFIGSVFGNIATMRIPVELFKPTFSLPGVVELEVATKIEPFLDQAVKDVRADSVHMGIGLPQSYTGKNVMVGVADWGFDYTHPMFYDTTLTTNRIFAAWDQNKIIGTPPAGYSYGAEYATTAALLAVEHDTAGVSSYHGTHVAGIAGGSGAGTAYRGVAFESDLLFTQLSFDISCALDAFQWMYNIAQSQGKRLVINNSWGEYRDNPMDGSSLMSQGFNAYADSGVVFVVSAGNSGSPNFHLTKNFSNDSIRSRINGFNYATDTNLWGQGISIWGETGQEFSAQIRILNGSNALLVQTPLFASATSPAFTDTFMVTGVDTIWYKAIVDAAHPDNGAPHMELNVKNTNTTLKTVLYCQGDTGRVHCWNSRLTKQGAGNTGYNFSAIGTGYVNGNNDNGIGHPGVTSNVITAAAYITGAGLTTFSSEGPRIDNVLKPDISAPGNLIVSSLNSFATGAFNVVDSVTFMSNTYKFCTLSGTSMSAPMITGAVALILEANPLLTPAEVKQLIINTARTDSYTGTISSTGHTRWGWGKLNVYDAIKGLSTISVDEIAVHGHYQVYPNPATELLNVNGKFDGSETYILNTLDGKVIATGKPGLNAINLSSFSSGVYLLTINSTKGKEMFKVVKE